MEKKKTTDSQRVSKLRAEEEVLKIEEELKIIEQMEKDKSRMSDMYGFNNQMRYQAERGEKISELDMMGVSELEINKQCDELFKNPTHKFVPRQLSLIDA